MGLADLRKTNGLIITAPGSGSGKTLITLGLIAALSAKGLRVAGAKTGPDYIDTSFLTLASGKKAINLDPWAMDEARLKHLAISHGADSDLLLTEGVMGLFDGAADGQGSTADLAKILGLPVILVVDAARQSQSIAALVSGFVNWRSDVKVAAIILNNVASGRHETILRNAVGRLDIPLLGILPREKSLELPNRHLGLVLPEDIDDIAQFSQSAGVWISRHINLEKLLTLAQPLPATGTALQVQNFRSLPPLGQHISIARDRAFAFSYAHWLMDWRRAGAQISFFSPLLDQGPDKDADAVFLPGGYPELHAEQLANAQNFKAQLKAASHRNALIYAECGGYMVLGETLTDKSGKTSQMTELLPHHTMIDRPRRVLGYRNLSHNAPLPWARDLSGHEFHYSSAAPHDAPALFEATDATGKSLPPMGARIGNVMGSYAHVIDIRRGLS